MTVAGAGEQIALPMTGNSAIFSFSRSLPDRDCIDDLAGDFPPTERAWSVASVARPQVLSSALLEPR